MPPNPNGEPGPDFSSFEGGAGAAGGIVGTNQLQSAIDKFTQAVDKLDTAVTKISGMGAGGAGAAAFGLTGGIPKMGQAGPAQSAPGAPTYFPPMVPAVFGAAAAGGATAASGSATTQPLPTMGSTAAGGGANGGGSSGIISPANMGAAGGALGAGGPGSAIASKGMSFLPAPLAAGIAGLAGAGAAQMPSQLALNTLQYTSSLGGQNIQTTRMGAMGTMGNAGNPQLNNQFSMNPQDAAAGYATLQQATANVNPYGTAYGAQNVMGAMGAMNVANPAMSAQQNAQAVGQLYAPSTSMRMMQMGYPTTPDVAGTGAHRSLPAIMAPLLNRMGGGKPMTQQQLFTQLQPGQRGNVSLQNLTGGNAAEMSQYTQGLELQNALMTGANGQQKMNLGQVDTTFKDLASQNTNTFNGAQSTLAKYGLKQSDFQALKSKAGGAAANVSDTSQGFTDGLQAATRTLSDFNTALHKIINSIPGARGVVGGAEGFLSNVLGGGAISPPAIAGGSKSPHNAGAMNKTAPVLATSAKATKAINLAMTQMGVPYAYGKETPQVGFDCSALPQWAYRQAGVYLPRLASEQWNYLQKNMISPLQVQKGDLVFGDSTGGSSMHEAMITDNGRHIIESPGVGGYVRTRPYNASEWKHAARPSDPTRNTTSKNLPKGSPGKANITSGGVTGTEVASYAKGFSTGTNHPYVTGGATPSGWDCSGFSAYVYEHFKLFPGHQGSRYGTSETQYTSSLLKASKDTAGALVFFDTHDGQAPPSHVGVSLGGGKYVGADDPAEGTVTHSSGGNMGFRVPKKGFTGGSAVSGGGATSATLTAAMGGPPGAPGAMGSSTGDSSDEGSTTEMSSFAGAIMGAASGPTVGSDYHTPVTSSSAATSTSGPFPAGGGAGGIPQNAQSIANYLGRAGLNKIAIAGILGNIMQESGGNPNAGANPPGKGLIQELGDPGGSVSADLPRVLKYIQANGSVADINRHAANPTAAAIWFSEKYERPGIPNLPNRISSAIASYKHGYASGGNPRKGSMAWVGERGPELVSFTQDATVHHAADSAKLMKSAMAKSPQGPWSAGAGATYAYSPLHPAYAAGGNAAGQGMTINVTMNMGGTAGTPGPTTAAGMAAVGRTSGERLAKAFAKQLQIELSKINLSTAIGTGVSS